MPFSLFNSNDDSCAYLKVADWSFNSKPLSKPKDDTRSDKLGEGTRSHATKANVASRKDELTVDNTMQSKQQLRINDEEEVVEAFRQQVNSERERLMALLEHIQAKEYVHHLRILIHHLPRRFGANKRKLLIINIKIQEVSTRRGCENH